MKIDRNRRRAMLASLASLAALAAPRSALSQAFPARPIRVICPFPAGGPGDILLRALANAAKSLGQPLVIENKAGAGGTIGAVETARARPDGYTLTAIPDGAFIVAHMENVGLDPVKDLTYLINLCGFTYGLVVGAGSPFNTMKELLDWAKANPGKLSYSTAGIGTRNHLAMEALAQRLGLTMLHVPYKGAGPAMTAVLAGEVMASSGASAWGPQVDAGKLKLLATYGSRRTRRWSHVPTLAELGYDIVADGPYGIAGPAGMDAAVVRTLHDALKLALEDPSVQQTLERNDMSPLYLGPEGYTQLARQMNNEAIAMVKSLGLARKG